MLRSLTEVFSKDGDVTIIKQNYTASISSARDRYSVDSAGLYDFIAWAIAKVADRHLLLAQHLLVDSLGQYPDRQFARLLIKSLPSTLVLVPAWFLLDTLTKRSKSLILK